MRNRFGGRCADCGGYVKAGMGEYLNGKVHHAEGSCPVNNLASHKPQESLNQFQPDKYQAAIGEAAWDGNQHVVVNATPGSGKTTVQCWSVTELLKRHPGTKALCLAFGNEDGERLRRKLPTQAAGRTTHSFGMGLIVQHNRKCKLNKLKDKQIIEDIVGPDASQAKFRNLIGQIVEKAKADAVRPDDAESLKETIKQYGIAVSEDDFDKVIEKTQKTLLFGLNIEKYGYNYNDMLYLPAILDYQFPKYDFIGLDESQDFSQSQIIMTEKLIATGARIMAVGDPNQSLYIFRGARADSFYRVAAALQSSVIGAANLPMPVCRRSAKSIVGLAQSIVPHMQALPNAPNGLTLFDESIERMLVDSKAGDLVVCRTNAPLLRTAWRFIKMGKPFYIRRGEQEAGLLVWLVDLLSNDRDISVSSLCDAADDWLEERKENCTGTRLQEWTERIEVIKLIGDRCSSAREVKKEIWNLFKEPANPNSCVVLSTIHKSKGSEAERVFHLRPDLVPHPKAETEEEKQQETNAKFVAITRAKTAYIELKGDLSEAA